jgi:hypothetical protein
MADVLLTCAETPLAWPASVNLTDVSISKTSTMNLFAAAPGPLQILTRRQNGAGDGVNFVESPTVGADYRGQRYSLDEVVFHTPGLHIFPGQKAVYPAELHIHMKTFAAPARAITVVIPASHLVAAQDDQQNYFAAAAAQPNSATPPPPITSLLVPGTDLLIYRGPDIRGRTADVPTPDAQCAADAMQREFVLVLNPAFIRATDLERIPREGSLSTDPRNLPASGVVPSQTVPRDRLLRCLRLARPGLASALQATRASTTPTSVEMECRPLMVVNGRDVIDISGRPVDIKQLLGEGSGTLGDTKVAATGPSLGTQILTGVSILVGLFLAELIMEKLVWTRFFIASPALARWNIVKVILFIGMAFGLIGPVQNLLGGS